MNTENDAEERLSRHFDEKGFVPGYEHFPDAVSARDFIQQEQDQKVFDQGQAAFEAQQQEMALAAAAMEGESAEGHQAEVDALAGERARENDELTNKAYSGVLKVERGLRETPNRGGMNGDGRNGINQTTQMMAEMASQTYQEAYNTELSFNIGGEDVGFTQGEMNTIAQGFAEAERERIERMRREGASEEAIRAAERNRRDYLRIVELTDSDSGALTAEEQEELQGILQDNPEVGERFGSYADRRDIANEYAERLEGLEDSYNSGAINHVQYDRERSLLMENIPEEIQADFDDVLEHRANSDRVGSTRNYSGIYQSEGASTTEPLATNATSAAKEIDPILEHDHMSARLQFNGPALGEPSVNNPATNSPDVAEEPGANDVESTTRYQGGGFNF